MAFARSKFYLESFEQLSFEDGEKKSGKCGWEFVELRALPASNGNSVFHGFQWVSMFDKQSHERRVMNADRALTSAEELEISPNAPPKLKLITQNPVRRLMLGIFDFFLNQLNHLLLHFPPTFSPPSTVTSLPSIKVSRAPRKKRASGKRRKECEIKLFTDSGRTDDCWALRR
jgi:hypothetical protein